MYKKVERLHIYTEVTNPEKNIFIFLYQNVDCSVIIHSGSVSKGRKKPTEHYRMGYK